MWIETDDIYKDRAERPDIFDLNYSDNLFLMKDKTKGIPIGETVCLKPKMYSVLSAGHDPKTLDDPDSEDPKKKHNIQKAKGVKKSVVKRELRYDKFLEYLRNKKLTRHDIYGLRSYDHQIYLERVNKIGLNPYDNKCWILLDGIRTLLREHWRIGLYKHLVASEISPKQAEERAIKAKLLKIYKMVDHKDIELAQVKVIKTALRKGRKYDNLAKNYRGYLKKLRAEKNPNDYIKTIAVKMFLNEEAYTLRLENYCKRYADNDLYTSLEELYKLYYQIAKEENCERSDDKIEQMLKAMAI
ncbi:17405_t:CDS:2 [Cetraspora pellucida]|uniref:17404_t:CDS:1 n=2 Tax=Cetraspora pellucida TaxID=1433469 RepID=A0ACA9L4M4_9GLOM|nr:17404_t:CDS:2 [Cetraspora pellucida]CAG8505789.1 17405_t:CDS:2 [Cetraspora pellucida]